MKSRQLVNGNYVAWAGDSNGYLKNVVTAGEPFTCAKTQMGSGDPLHPGSKETPPRGNGFYISAPESPPLTDQ